jgi:hypothetical protein
MLVVLIELQTLDLKRNPVVDQHLLLCGLDPSTRRPFIELIEKTHLFTSFVYVVVVDWKKPPNEAVHS